MQGLATEAFTLLILDSEPVFARGLARLLEETTLGFQVVGIFFSSSDSEETISKLHPDLVVMDARFGLEPGSRIRTMSPHTRVVLVARADQAVDLQEALKAEIQGCLVRESEVDEIVDVLRLVLRDHIVVHAAAARVSLTPGPSPLTETEQEILGGIARGETNREIATRLHFSERTIRRRTLRVYSKLGVRDRVEAAVCAGRLLSGGQRPQSSPDSLLQSTRFGPDGIPLTA